MVKGKSVWLGRCGKVCVSLPGEQDRVPQYGGFQGVRRIIAVRFSTTIVSLLETGYIMLCP